MLFDTLSSELHPQVFQKMQLKVQHVLCFSLNPLFNIQTQVKNIFSLVLENQFLQALMGLYWSILTRLEQSPGLDSQRNHMLGAAC